VHGKKHASGDLAKTQQILLKTRARDDGHVRFPPEILKFSEGRKKISRHNLPFVGKNVRALRFRASLNKLEQRLSGARVSSQLCVDFAVISQCNFATRAPSLRSLIALAALDPRRVRRSPHWNMNISGR
jgi:hypothetical protein